MAKRRTQIHFYSRHIGDYSKDAGHLTMLQDGAYTRMLDQAYAAGGVLPLDLSALYERVRAKTAAERSAVDKVLAEFWFKRDDGYHQRRVDREVAAIRACSSKRSKAAKKRWASKSPAMQVHSTRTPIQKPSTNSHPLYLVRGKRGASFPLEAYVPDAVAIDGDES